MPALAKPASRPAKTAAAPKPKPAAAKPKAAAAAGASHPPYFEMIKEAITALKERTGSSSHAIAKYMEDKHGASLPANYKKMLSIQLRGFAAKGKLVKVKASYKLSDAAKKESPKAKPAAAAKPAAPKPAKAAAKPKKSAATAAKPKKTAAAAAGTKRKAPEKKKIVAKPKKSPAAKAKAKPKTVKSPATKKARKVAA
ncbi:unnamed protein product [Urochloa humidicola]